MILSIIIGLKLAFLYSVGAFVLTNNLSNADNSFLTDILSGLVLSNPNSEYATTSPKDHSDTLSIGKIILSKSKFNSSALLNINSAISYFCNSNASANILPNLLLGSGIGNGTNTLILNKNSSLVNSLFSYLSIMSQKDDANINASLLSFNSSLFFFIIIPFYWWYIIYSILKSVKKQKN